MTTSSSITYSYLSQKIIDSEASSEEILDSLSAQQKIELLEKKRIEQAIIEIPTIEPPKQDKHQSSKIKLWELCSWLPKTYFAKIKANFTSILKQIKSLSHQHGHN
ncbi:12182_t:CDS:2 [Dentiscutata heterogama]|uniref:12182_t:CDS:1 n=1 Tax=Dentiscutata heterogama TaxID=1316150 RepID=A0ACA9LX16_9GLOM|nr:12182_t:CDS:2 [Dentiscutata heterogama]